MITETPLNRAVSLLDEARSILAAVSCCDRDAIERPDAEKLSEEIDQFLESVGYEGKPIEAEATE